jgi:hypothetical protein
VCAGAVLSSVLCVRGIIHSWQDHVASPVVSNQLITGELHTASKQVTQLGSMHAAAGLCTCSAIHIYYQERFSYGRTWELYRPLSFEVLLHACLHIMYSPYM